MHSAQLHSLYQSYPAALANGSTSSTRSDEAEI